MTLVVSGGITSTVSGILFSDKPTKEVVVQAETHLNDGLEQQEGGKRDSFSETPTPQVKSLKSDITDSGQSLSNSKEENLTEKNNEKPKDTKSNSENQPVTQAPQESTKDLGLDSNPSSNPREQVPAVKEEPQLPKNNPVRGEGENVPKPDIPKLELEQAPIEAPTMAEAKPSNRSWFSIGSRNYNDLEYNEISPDVCQKTIEGQQITFDCEWDLSSPKTNIRFSFFVTDYPDLQNKKWEELNEIDIYTLEDSIQVGFVFKDELEKEIRVPISAPEEYLKQFS
ncbi:hypothetical protein OVS_03995 [Mycoplasma ovis str. Michigan]|uniref:Uncharacterized protein n=2 Tax=Mycoplasma ovis TaxID=171632 RepID=A0ABM5P295_9MOLU|nr:hypothetical protein OVS_03995 [Mycoplasma ovis str. Michigan]